jgi:hypothetical protein
MPRFLLGIAIACVVSGAVHQVWGDTELTIAVGAFTAIGIWFRALEYLADAVGAILGAILRAARD